MLELERLPRTLTVIGGGVIGVEYATIFSALDVPVTLIEPRDTILDFVDREIVDDFIHQMRDRGMTIRLGSRVKEVTAIEPDYAQVTLADGRSHPHRDRALCRRPHRQCRQPRPRGGRHRGRLPRPHQGRPADLPDQRAEHLCAGDVIGFPSLASTSMEQGRVAACHAFGVPLPPPPETFPYGIYAVPEISTVGQSEEQVRESGVAYEVGVARFRETSRGHIMGVNSGFLKLIFRARYAPPARRRISSARARPN